MTERVIRADALTLLTRAVLVHLLRLLPESFAVVANLCLTYDKGR